MIITSSTNNVEIDQEINVSEQSMHIAEDCSSSVIRMLTRAYSDPIGSIIRESISNSSDSHIMANNPNPVICKLRKDEVGNWIFEAIDNGLGLDEKEFHKYIMGVGASSKVGLPGVLGN